MVKNIFLVVISLSKFYVTFDIQKFKISYIKFIISYFIILSCSKFSLFVVNGFMKHDIRTLILPVTVLFEA